MLPVELQSLEKLAFNLWWSWQPDGPDLWRSIDEHRWERCHHNPAALLRKVEPARWTALAADTHFKLRLRALSERLDAYLVAPTWYGQEFAEAARVAYFSMEFGLHDSLRTYSGGLGVLAGDHLRSASDLGVPLTGFTLFYHQGYFKQVLDDGRQVACYTHAALDRLPIRACNDEHGQPITVTVHLGDWDVRIWCWAIDIGRTRLFLLDTDREPNPEAVRQACRQLYGGDEKNRILQEAILGIGGVRMVRALGLTPDVWHMNEGHCAFVPLELLREQTEAGQTWEQALAHVRARCCFTTHTPVPAGHDRFPTALVQSVLGPFREAAGWPKGSIMDLGRVHSGDFNETLCMTVVAMRTSHSTNGVSRKHGEVSRNMWKDMWPGTPPEQVPIGHITNGVHPTFWMAPEAQALFDMYVRGWRERPWDVDLWRASLEHTPDEAIWKTRHALRARLAAFVERRANVVLDPGALTLGFARRFATYKRGDMLFADPDRLHRILERAGRAQILFAGKAHPRDVHGQAVLQRVIEWSEDPRFRGRVFFIEDYDISVGAALTSGVDVWVNNPRRPLEASGTSGQKVTLNLGLNLSVLDGWWLEAFDGDNGWPIGDTTITHDNLMDAADGEALYRVLEDQILPAWLERDPRGIPVSWVKRIRNSTITCASTFNSHRMVRDYASALYRVMETDPPRVERP